MTAKGTPGSERNPHFSKAHSLNSENESILSVGLTTEDDAAEGGNGPLLIKGDKQEGEDEGNPYERNSGSRRSRASSYKKLVNSNLSEEKKK